MIAEIPQTLADLKASSVGHVQALQGDPVIQQRLAEMGLTRGREVRMVRVAPLGDPFQIEVLNYHLSLRRNECECILLAPGQP